MSNEVAASLVTGISGVFAALVSVALPLYLQNRGLKSQVALLKENKDAVTLVARGLAVGYYNNFFGTVFDMLQSREIDVLLDSRDVESGVNLMRFRRQRVRFVCIIPAQLIGVRISQCVNKLEQYHKGEIVRGENIRGFTINYSVASCGSERELVIYDVAKPAFAIREYLKYFRNLKEEDPSWLQLSNIALESFKETLDSLRTNSSAIGSDQFGFDLIS